MSLFSGIVRVIAGAAAIAAGILIEIGTLGGGTFAASLLISAGAGLTLQGLGTLIAGEHSQGLATTTRNPIAPWKIINGQARTGGTLVYMNMWGNNNQMLDLVIVLTAHSCQSVDTLLFDEQQVAIDASAVPYPHGGGPGYPGATIGGTSYTPVQQKVPIANIIRANDVVTVHLNANIPTLQAGYQVNIVNVTGDTTLNGVYQVAEIISQTFGSPGSIVFTYLCGGNPANVINAGYVETLWADYGRDVYMEVLLGNQIIGQSFNGMVAGTPWQGTGQLVTPLNPGPAGLTNDTTVPNPWTKYCSLQGKTAIFLRLKYSSNFKAGLPQISFKIHGKNDIYDPRLGSCTGIGTAGVSSVGSGYTAGDVLDVSGGTGGQVVVTSVSATGQIETTMVNPGNQGNGYSVSSGNAASGGTGTGAAIAVLSLTGDHGATGYTENAALCIADMLANQTWGFKAAWGTEIPFAPLITAANHCDEAIALAIGGTEPRYTCNGQFELSMRRGEILQNLLTSCAGRLTYIGGQFVIWPGVWYGASPAAVDLKAIAAGPMRWKPTVSIRDLYNGVKGTFISPYNQWQSTDFPYYAQDSIHGYFGPPQYGGDINLAADGGERRWLDIQLPFTISSSMAQRIAKVELLRRRHQGTGTFPVNMAGYQFVPMDIVSATHSILGWSGKDLEVAAARLRFDEQTEGGVKTIRLGVELDVQETDSSIYAWSDTEELSPQGYQQLALPGNSVVEPAPYPWSPGYVAPLDGDALYPEGHLGPGTFGMQPVYDTDAAGNANTSLLIKGTAAFNDLDTGIGPPYVQATASATGGSIPAGHYVVGVSAYDAGASPYKNTEYLDLANVVVPSGGTGSITLAITWGSGDDGGDVYMANWESGEQYTFHYQGTLSPGQTSIAITQFDQSGAGGPDPLFYRFAITWSADIHGGNWAEQVQAVTPTTIIFGQGGGDAAMTVNQWQGYVLTLIAKADPTAEIPVLNIPIASSTATDPTVQQFTITVGPNSAGATLPDLTTLLAIGDLLVCRFNPTFTANSFTDSNMANPYYPTGMDGTGSTGPEAGHLAVVLTGPDAGDMQTVAGTSDGGTGKFTTVNLAGSWAVTPNAGDIVIIVAPPLQPAGELCPPLTIPNKTMGSVIAAQPAWINLPGQAYLITVRAEDQAGNPAGYYDAYAPKREIYFFGVQGTRTVTD
jgi:hypothetical protein